MAKAIARKLGYIYVDTGAMYRAVTLFALRKGLFRPDGTPDTDALRDAMTEIEIDFRFNPAADKADTFLCGENVESLIRGMEVSSKVSSIAAIGFVREAMTERQRAIGSGKGTVMDGRDIGTTVFPDAELKVFVTASPEVRAKRRYSELAAKGVHADYNEILENVKQRDYADSHRSISPLRKAPDALLLDNGNMTIDEQNRWMEEKAMAIING